MKASIDESRTYSHHDPSNARNAMQCSAMQFSAMQCDVGLKGPRQLQEHLAQTGEWTASAAEIEAL